MNGYDLLANRIALIMLIVALIVFLAAFVWTYITKTGEPDPNRLSVRIFLAVASAWDNATWPARGAR